MGALSSNEIPSIKNMKFVNFNVVSSRYFVIISLFIIGFVISETSIVIAQESQPNVNTIRDKTTSLIPLNSTEIELGIDNPGFEIDNTPVINIDNQKFWKFFDPLLEN